MNILFVGGGNMASALIGGLLKQGWSPAQLRVLEIDASQRERLTREFGVEASADPQQACRSAECVLFAVKPQQLRTIAQELQALVRGALVITIAAGIRESDLSRWLGGHRRIVRAMPNTPALALSGMTGLYAPAHVAREDRDTAGRILGVAGRTLWVER
jgi:pyrroline-5-carboxylate reductase